MTIVLCINALFNIKDILCYNICQIFFSVSTNIIFFYEGGNLNLQHPHII